VCAERAWLRRGVTSVAIGLLVLLALAGAVLRTEAAPLGIVSLQFAGDVARAADILASWEGATWRTALLLHGLDLLLPFAYGAAFVLWARHLGTDGLNGDGRLVRGTVAVAILAAAADQAENIAMLVTMLHRPLPTPVAVTPVLAVLKFTGLGLALLGVLALRYRTSSRISAREGL
jgi:hypothetical protein